MFEDLGVKVMLSAAYSYSAAACELFFANFKKVDINPAKKRLSKK